MGKYIDIEPLEKDGWMLRRNTFTIDSATVELKHLRDFPTVEISDIITSDNEYMGSVVQGRWIPVTERLPEEHEDVLTSDSVFGITFDSICNGKWRKHPVAWMPLPSPYKGGEEE